MMAKNKISGRLECYAALPNRQKAIHSVHNFGLGRMFSIGKNMCAEATND